MSFVLDNSVTMRWFFLATANHKNLPMQVKYLMR
jgi:hypothetical protein